MSEVLRVLIVEDSEDDARLVLRELRRSGYEPVSERVDSEAAMRKALADQPWELILSDYVLPGFGGLEALRILKESSLDLPFILVSNKVSEETLVEAMRAGATDFVMKDRLSRLGPVVKRELVDAAARHAVKRAQEAELEQFKLAETFFNHSVSCIAILDRDFNFVRVNEAYARACRKDVSEFTGRNHFEMYPSDAKAIFEEVIRTRRPYETSSKAFVYHDQPERGTTYWDWTLVPVLDRNGEVEYLVFSLNDVTERTRAIEALREREEMLRTIATSAQDAILMLDNDGKILLWNAAAEKMFGYSSEQALGKDLHLLLAPARFHEAHRAGFRHFVSTGDGPVIGKTLELAALRMDGSEFPIELSLAAVKLKDRWHAAGIVRDITARKRVEQALLKVNRALKALSSCSEVLIHATDEAQLLREMCRIIVEIAGYRLAWVGFAEHDANKTVRPVAHAGYDDGFIERANISWADNQQGAGPAGKAIRTQEPCVVQDAHADPAYEKWRINAITIGYGSVAGFPLASSGKVFGALCIYSSTIHGFGEEEIRLLTELAGDLAYGIDALRTRALEAQGAERLLRSMEGTILAMGAVVEMRDPYTAGHQRRVSRLSAAMAREMGLTESDIHGISLAAAVHDLGKIQVPAEILVKPGKLTDIEFSLIKGHSQAGYDILKEVDFPWPVAQMVYQHHERIDGSGYPRRLKAPEILIGAKIMAVADTVEAMSSHRPYRPGLGIDKALEEIVKNRGRLYDARAVDSCVRLFNEGKFRFPE